MSVSKSRNALTFGWNLTLEIARGLLSRIRKGRSRRKRRRLCVILSSAGRINDKLNGFQWQVRYRKTCVISIQKKSMDFGLIDFFCWFFRILFSLFLEYVLHLYQVHAMLDFAEDLEECRKIQFAKFVLFSLVFFFFFLSTLWKWCLFLCFFFFFNVFFYFFLFFFLYRFLLKKILKKKKKLKIKKIK